MKIVWSINTSIVSTNCSLESIPKSHSNDKFEFLSLVVVLVDVNSKTNSLRKLYESSTCQCQSWRTNKQLLFSFSNQIDFKYGNVANKCKRKHLTSPLVCSYRSLWDIEGGTKRLPYVRNCKTTHFVL